MNLEAILALWQDDSVLNPTNLASESLKTPSLHHKYLTILTHERMNYHRIDGELKRLKTEKMQWFDEGDSEETRELGWVFPRNRGGKIHKPDQITYLEADPDYQKLMIKLLIQKEKITALESIINSINNRQWQIRNAVEYLKFTQGMI